MMNDGGGDSGYDNDYKHDDNNYDDKDDDNNYDDKDDDMIKVLKIQMIITCINKFLSIRRKILSFFLLNFLFHNSYLYTQFRSQN